MKLNVEACPESEDDHAGSFFQEKQSPVIRELLSDGKKSGLLRAKDEKSIKGMAYRS